MKTNLAFALETTTATIDTGARTLDPIQLDRLLSGQARPLPVARTTRTRRKLVSLQDNHSGLFPMFRVR